MFKTTMSFIFIFCFISSVNASVLWDQTEWNGIIYGTSGKALSNDLYGPDYWLADDFNFKFNSSISSITWGGGGAFESVPDVNGFWIRFLTQDGLADGSFIYDRYFQIDDVVLSPTFYYDPASSIYTVNLQNDPFFANKETSYWLSIQADTIGQTIDDWWGWSGNNIGITTPAYSFADKSFWNGWDMFYQINGTQTPVPEPSTFLLLGGGLAGLVFVVRRKRKE